MESQGLAGGMEGALDVCLCRGSEVGRGMLVDLDGNGHCQRGLYGGRELGCGLWVVDCVGWGSGVIR